MVKGLSLWIDYDRDKLPGLTPALRIEYFEKRVRLVAINPLRRILDSEIIVKGEESSALLIFGVSLCCAIEAAGKFLTGGRVGGNRARFEAFLHGYMSKDFQERKLGAKPYGRVLWEHFRNGLAHGFVVRHGGFEGNAGEPYFKVRTISGHSSLEINPTRFLEDYVGGFERYLADLRAAGAGDALFVDFNATFEAVFIRGE